LIPRTDSMYHSPHFLFIPTHPTFFLYHHTGLQS
jgi:hypothetical protein